MSGLNKEAIRLWIDDLRSGEFKQGKGQLRYGNRFCCLGVACETYRRATGEGKWTEDGYFVMAGDNSRIVLPAKVTEWLGVEESNPYLNFPRGASAHCTDANDADGRKFRGIATALEHTYLR